MRSGPPQKKSTNYRIIYLCTGAPIDRLQIAPHLLILMHKEVLFDTECSFQ
jgi:hypothetical protein